MINLINKIKNYFKKKEEIEIPVFRDYPCYVKKLERKYNRDLTEEYFKLKKDGITGKKLIKKTLLTYIKGNMEMD